VDRAVEQVRRAVGVLMHLQQQLEALQWDMESEEMDEELLRLGYVQTAPDEWTSPAGESALSQFQALLRVDEEADKQTKQPCAWLGRPAARRRARSRRASGANVDG